MKKIFIMISFFIVGNAFAQDSEPNSIKENQDTKSNSFLQISERVSGWNAPIFYNIRDLRRLDEALQIYDYQAERARRSQLLASSNAESDEELDELLRGANQLDKFQTGDGLTEVTTSVFPVFYLSSIMYYSPEQWTIWINNKKITKDTEPSTLEVVSVSKDKIELLWRPSDYGLIQDELASRDPQNNAIDENIKLDMEKQLVSFSLMPNQSFVSETIEIVEGKAEETEVILSETKLVDGEDNDSLFEAIEGDSKPNQKKVQNNKKTPSNPKKEALSTDIDEQNMQNAIGILKTLTKSPIGE
jgi:hypothetical protein